MQLILIGGGLALALYWLPLLVALRWRRTPRPALIIALERVMLALTLPYSVALVLLMAVQVVFPQRSGVLALTQVFAPYLFVPTLAWLPLIRLRRVRWLPAALAACGAVFLLRFGLPQVAGGAAQSAAASHITVMNWNVHMCCGAEQQAGRVRPVLLARPADVVVLEEAHWSWLRDDAAVRQVYPHQLHNVYRGSWGIIVLSAMPILDYEIPSDPANPDRWIRWIKARIEVAPGRDIVLVAAHPEVPQANPSLPVLGYDPAGRDAMIGDMRRIIDPLLREGQPVLVAGDMNTSEREPAYQDLSAGLQDAHRMVGSGWGHSWGLTRGTALPPLLRLDYLFSSPELAPQSLVTDCAPRGSDHCVITGVFAWR